jgi:hypothetical protein
MPDRATTIRRRTAPTRALLTVAALLLALYGVNVGLGVAAVRLHASGWRLGDVGEFLLVLSGMAFFVAGLMVDEQSPASTAGDPVGAMTSEGGER